MKTQENMNNIFQSMTDGMYDLSEVIEELQEVHTEYLRLYLSVERDESERISMMKRHDFLTMILKFLREQQ